jgi:3-phenylpropionate/trans-cinnamate dioxygenase alpha subunit
MLTELWYFTFVDKNASEEMQREQRLNSARTFGASGMLEQDDGENWDQSTRCQQGVISGRPALQMGKNRAKVARTAGPARVATLTNSTAVWHCRA